jgi:hypothetical protein
MKYTGTVFNLLFLSALLAGCGANGRSPTVEPANTSAAGSKVNQLDDIFTVQVNSSKGQEVAQAQAESACQRYDKKAVFSASKCPTAECASKTYEFACVK